MASTVPVLLLLFAGLFAATIADDDCKPYSTSNGILKPSIECGYFQFCCGTCDSRYCCSNAMKKLTEDQQEHCFFQEYQSIAVGVTVSGIVILIIMFIVCCVCPCCCLYKMCRKPRPIVGATTTTVVTTQYPQQPVVQGSQYPPYQPIPPQSGYSGAPGYSSPMPAAPYQGQPYAAGPPPPYQEAGGPGYPVPYSQAAFDGGQAAYPMQPPAQPGYPQPGYPQPGYGQPGYAQPPPPTDYRATQPAYNPAYVEPPKTGY